MKCQLVMLGNHDQGAMFDPDGFNPPAERAIFWTRARSSNPPSEDRTKRQNAGNSWRSGHASTSENGFLFVHGSARNPLNEYVFPEDIYNQRKMDRIFALVDKYCFQGHTHVPGVFTESLDDELSIPAPEKIDSTYKLDDRKTLINVGSVGQPRDGDWRACYVCWTANDSLSAASSTTSTRRSRRSTIFRTSTTSSAIACATAANNGRAERRKPPVDSTGSSRSPARHVPCASLSYLLTKIQDSPAPSE